jgi:hypothetical protein
MHAVNTPHHRVKTLMVDPIVLLVFPAVMDALQAMREMALYVQILMGVVWKITHVMRT